MKKAIADTGPVIAFAKLGKLNLLKSLFEEINIPKAVYKELMGGFGDEAQAIENALNDFIKVFWEDFTTTEEIEHQVQNLGRGEREAMLLACSWKEDVLLIVDDKSARNSARRLNLTITGTVGVILWAKWNGLINHVTKTLLDIRNNGYWLSDKIIMEARKIADE